MLFWWLKQKRQPEKDLNELTAGLQQALGNRLKSAIVFGSFVSGDFQPARSNLNVLIISDLSLSSLEAMGPAMKSWLKKGHLPPVLVAPDEMDDFARDFPIEFLDMKDVHRVLYGTNPIDALTVDKKHLESQCEHDLAVAQLRLRQGIAAAAGDEKAIRRVLVQSLPSVFTLMRAVVRLKENVSKLDKMQAADQLAKQLGLDPAPLHQLHEMHIRRGDDTLKDLATYSLVLIEAVLTYLRKN